MKVAIDRDGTGESGAEALGYRQTLPTGKGRDQARASGAGIDDAWQTDAHAQELRSRDSGIAQCPCDRSACACQQRFGPERLPGSDILVQPTHDASAQVTQKDQYLLGADVHAQDIAGRRVEAEQPRLGASLHGPLRHL